MSTTEDVCYQTDNGNSEPEMGGDTMIVGKENQETSEKEPSLSLQFNSPDSDSDSPGSIVSRKKKIHRIIDCLDDSDSDVEANVRTDPELLQVPDEPEQHIHDDRDRNKPAKEVQDYRIMFQDTDLYDAEGSSDESSNNCKTPSLSTNDEELGDNMKNPKSKKKQVKSKSTNGKSAVDEIHSETQRMVRQSRISLPYHHPKQRSLSDFLQRRLSTPVVPLHTSTDRLSKVWEHLEKREKTVANLYKSDEEEVSEEENNPKRNKVINNDSSSVNLRLPSDLDSAVLNKTESEQKDETEMYKKSCLEKDSVGETNINNENNKITSSMDINGCDIDFTFQLPSSMTEQSEEINSETEDNIITKEIISSPVRTLEQMQDISLDSKDITVNESESIHPKTDLLIKNQKSIENVNEQSGCQEQMSESLKGHSQSFDSSLFDIQLDMTPRLSGSPNDIIDLDDTSAKAGPLGLIKRFIKHVAIKPKKKLQEKTTVSVVTQELDPNGEIIKLTEECVSVNNVESKPGEKFAALKASLQHAIAVNREQQWVKRVQEYKLNEDEFFEEEKFGYEETVKEVEGFPIRARETDSESEEEEEEEDEEEIVEDKKSRKKSSMFIDSEAEVSDEPEESGDEEEIDDNQSAVSSANSTGTPSDTEDLEAEDASKEWGTSKKSQSSSILGDLKEQELPPNEEELMALCSGKFVTQSLKLKDLEGSQYNTHLSESEDLKLVYSEDTMTREEFTSKTNTGLESSDEEDILSKRPVKRNLKLAISDEEDEEEVGEEAKPDTDDEIADNDVGSIEDEEIEAEAVDGVGFLDAEAELSGSEWDSADEDENDMDDLEMEQADNENIDQNKLQRELGRIHVKEMIAEDKKEINILKELLFEDGDLHSDGPKRQRLYRWSNNPGGDDFGDQKAIDGLSSGQRVEEDEEDDAWMRTRHEREQFLKNNSNRDDTDEELDSSIRTVGPRPATKTPVLKADTLTSPDPKHPFKLITKRGSFLSRGDSVLSKLAEITSTCDLPLGKSKGKRKMVFAVVSPPKEDPPEMEKNLKRKSIEATALVSKRLKYSNDSGNKRHSILEQLRQSDINVA